MSLALKPRPTLLSIGILLLIGVVLSRRAKSVDEPQILEIAPVGPVVNVHGDFQFTEGPGADGQGKL